MDDHAVLEKIAKILRDSPVWNQSTANKIAEVLERNGFSVNYERSSELKKRDCEIENSMQDLRFQFHEQQKKSVIEAIKDWQSKQDWEDGDVHEAIEKRFDHE